MNEEPRYPNFSAKLPVAKSKISNSKIGFVNLVKPGGITSHDLVNALRKITGIKQIGHSGTLDPMAQGVMILGLSKACRLIQYLQSDKTYVGEIFFGTRTDTDDMEGKILAQDDPLVLNKISSTDIGSALKTFLGKIEQIPPAYSAIKIKGVKMYELARKGETLPPEDVKARSVEVKSIEILNFEMPRLSLRIDCSSGTYIRSIARDLGEALGVNACLSSLLRERVGPFHLSDSIELEQFQEAWQKDDFSCIVSPAMALQIPSIEMDAKVALRLVNGQVLDSSDEHKDGLFMAEMEGEPVCLVGVDSGKMKARVVLKSQEQF